MLLHIFLCDDWFCSNLKRNSKSLENGFQNSFVNKKGKFSLTSLLFLGLAQLACSPPPSRRPASAAILGRPSGAAKP
jgi:hypothetical protein